MAMFAAGMDDWDGDDIVKLPADRVEFTFNLLGPILPFMGGGSAIRSAPPIISESMTFPYLRGLIFCAKIANKGGWASIDRVYHDPPVSTEQILHPEKYRSKPDYPMNIDLGAVTPGDGWKEIGRNVLGEMQTAIMLRKHGGAAAAAGWDGDRYAVFEGSRKQLGLIWLSTWDTEPDAREFARAYVGYQTTKVGKLGKPPKPIPDKVWRNLDDSLYVVERRGRDVAVVENFSPTSTPGLVESLFKARQTEMRPRETGEKRPDSSPRG